MRITEASSFLRRFFFEFFSCFEGNKLKLGLQKKLLEFFGNVHILVRAVNNSRKKIFSFLFSKKKQNKSVCPMDIVRD